MAVPAGPRACPPCPCPTRLRRARRPPAGHRSGEAASCAAGMANRRTRARRRRCRARRGYPVRRSSADRVTSALRLEISPEGPGFSSEFGPVRAPRGHLRGLGHQAATPPNRPGGLLSYLPPQRDHSGRRQDGHLRRRLHAKLRLYLGKQMSELARRRNSKEYLVVGASLGELALLFE